LCQANQNFALKRGKGPFFLLAGFFVRPFILFNAAEATKTGCILFVIFVVKSKLWAK
jgi:hypothetical protein